MAVIRFLLVWLLLAGGAHNGAEGEILFCGFADHFKRAVRQLAGIPEWLALLSDDDGVAQFQIHDGIEERHAECYVIRVGQGFGQREFIQCAVTRFALHILDGGLVGVNVAVAHGFAARVAVHAVEGVFTLGKLGNWLVVIVETVCRLVGAFNEGHCPQVVVAAIVARIALGVWNGS